MAVSNLPSKGRLKQAAKRLEKQTTGLSHMAALELAAQGFGLASYADFLEQDKQRHGTVLLPEYLTQQVFDWFRTAATKHGVDFSIFYPTETGLGKAILDATSPVRLHFMTAGLHDYAQQQKGPDHRVRKPAYFLAADKVLPRMVSLYRPMTKHGDSRMWFNGLPDFARPNDTVAIVIDQGVPYLVNLRALASELAEIAASAASAPLALVEVVQGSLWYEEQGNDVVPAWTLGPLPVGFKATHDFLMRVGGRDAQHSQALVSELMAIANSGPIRASSAGDTAVGIALEQALNIKQNSSRNPDYKNRIEIKAARQKAAGRRTRQTLFAQVADWGHSRTVMKSSAAILDAYGYMREDVRKLYCTVAANSTNSQGLSFEVSDDGSLLMEVHKTDGIVAVWSLATLVSRLLQKHSETFWVEAKSMHGSDGGEYFTLISARHTKAPLASQLLPLIREGYVTMDHLVKRREDGTVTEKGPLFKLAPEGFKLLFPEPVLYRFDKGNTAGPMPG